MPASVKHLSHLNELGAAVDLILARWSGDMLFYKVDVLECDSENKRCQVRFEDGHQCYIDCQNLHLQLALGYIKDDQIVCSICDDGKSETPNPIIICDICQQGFHINCHTPKPNETILDNENEEWSCGVCSDLMKYKKKVSSPTNKRKQTSAKKLPSQSPKLRSQIKLSRPLKAKSLSQKVHIDSPKKETKKQIGTELTGPKTEKLSQLKPESHKIEKQDEQELTQSCEQNQTQDQQPATDSETIDTDKFTDLVTSGEIANVTKRRIETSNKKAEKVIGATRRKRQEPTMLISNVSNN